MPAPQLLKKKKFWERKNKKKKLGDDLLSHFVSVDLEITGRTGIEHLVPPSSLCLASGRVLEENGVCKFSSGEERMGLAKEGKHYNDNLPDRNRSSHRLPELNKKRTLLSTCDLKSV